MSRVANLAIGLRKRHNDTLAALDVADLAARFRLPVNFVRRMVDEEIKRRGGDAA
jgi:hypothetical protein